MKFEIPGPLKAEHEELHAELVKAVGAGGQTGAAAKRVAEVLHAHFVREEEIAMPPLGLLAHLARGGVTADMAEVLPMTESLKAELGRMLGEHEDIVAALGGPDRRGQAGEEARVRPVRREARAARPHRGGGPLPGGDPGRRVREGEARAVGAARGEGQGDGTWVSRTSPSRCAS